MKWQIQHLGEYLFPPSSLVPSSELIVSTWKKGEVLLSNHPGAGGSHLPDFTVITPVYLDESKRSSIPYVIVN